MKKQVYTICGPEYYDPTVGRFISKDTYEGSITNPLALNLYTYVENNPLVYIDPTGHLPRVNGFMMSESFSAGGGSSGAMRFPNLSPSILSNTWKERIAKSRTRPLPKAVKPGIGLTKKQIEFAERPMIKGKGLDNAYDVAKSGGKHSGFYKQYIDKSLEQINKGIKSIDRQIAEHQDKIRNPEKHIPNFRNLDPRQQDALINKKWLSDIQRQMEQKQILEQF